VRAASAGLLALVLSACSASAPQPYCLPASVHDEPESHTGLGPVPRAQHDAECLEESPLDPRDATVRTPAPGVTLGQGGSLAAAATLPWRKPLTMPDGLRLEFIGVKEDSRCPAGARCVHAGRARIELVASKPGAAEQRFELSLPGAAETRLGYSLTLIELDASPLPGRPAQPDDYVATIAIAPVRSETPRARR
jgi:hypothetical protein